MLQGERPYWWVKEHSTNISLIQTPLTCETGPGVPSGHSQAAATIMFCLLDSISGHMTRGTCLLYIIFVISQVLMWSSRLYISAHFPHQCLLGCAVGLLVIRYCVLEKENQKINF